MNKTLKYVLPLLAATAANPAAAQTGTEAFLQRIESTSPFIAAEREDADARITASRAGIGPENPDAEFAYMPGIERTESIRKSYSFTQTLAWPGEYVARSKYGKLERQQAETQYAGLRQDILLRAKLLCYDLVYLQKRGKLLDERLENARNLESSLQKMFDTGAATSLDLNKARINRTAVETLRNENRSQLEAKRQQLAALAGTDDFRPEEFAYADNPAEDPEKVFREALEASPEIRAALLEADKSARNVSIQRGSTLPSISVGVAGERLSPTDSFLGVTTGISIPLWGGVDKVKAAKAQHRTARLRSENLRLETEAAIREKLTNVEQLKRSLAAYASLQEVEEGKRLLQKSFDLRSITVTNYLTDVQFYYDAEENYLSLELNLYKALAEILKYRL